MGGWVDRGTGLGGWVSGWEEGAYLIHIIRLDVAADGEGVGEGESDERKGLGQYLEEDRWVGVGGWVGR